MEGSLDTEDYNSCRCCRGRVFGNCSGFLLRYLHQEVTKIKVSISEYWLKNDLFHIIPYDGIVLKYRHFTSKKPTADILITNKR
jgi:hypothetical protein